MTLKSIANSAEKVLLVGFSTDESKRSELIISLNELKELTETAGGEVIKTVFQIRNRADSKYLIGAGKLEEIRNICEIEDISLVIFDEEISPSQQRNIEKNLKCRVIDRTALILDIFAIHAHTSESKLQVELAKYSYDLPRLKNEGVDYSQQVGMIGARGPGETQLELDRRAIKKRISILKEKLKTVENQRKIQGKERGGIPAVAIIGYTNAGKSSLINLLTGAGAIVEDKLFATLDSTSRKFILPNNKKIILTDTVGFIRKLPHQLVEAFKSTLEVVKYADILLHIVDSSDPNIDLKISAVYSVLEELKIGNIPTITFFNKCDELNKDDLKIHKLKNQTVNAVIGSVKENKNIDILLSKIIEILNKKSVVEEFKIPHSKYYLLSKIFDRIQINKKEYDEENVIVEIEGEKEYIEYLRLKLNGNPPEQW